MRACANCGIDITHKRADARACGVRCRVALCRKRYARNDVTPSAVKDPRPARDNRGAIGLSLRERMGAVTARAVDLSRDGLILALRQEKEALRAENRQLRAAQGKQYRLAGKIQAERKLRLAAEEALQRLALSLGRRDSRPFLAVAGLL